MLKKVTKKKKWLGLEVTKVKLNPDQAVLSCCESVAKALIAGDQCNVTCGDDKENVSS
ncbi:MAG: hypothetical protein PHP69_03840 [Candidatus Omnitrophica bacterium]|nr:hypothetical protein [Candidatus Omnitrophota bacterium]MDD5441481.1 hypothetical protein [Candidatus Omnitrophota bacterium]